MKSWVQEISKKYAEQNYILFENKFDLISRILKENGSFVFNVQQNAQAGTGGTGGAGGNATAKATAKAKAKVLSSKELLDLAVKREEQEKKNAARRAKTASETPEERKERLTKRYAREAKAKAKSQASATASAPGGPGGQGGPAGNQFNVNFYGGGSGGSGTNGEREPKKLYRVERRLKSVIGPVTRAIGVVKGVGSGLDKMMGGAGGVLSGAEEIGNTLTPSTSKQLQLYRQLGKQLTPDEIAILTGNKKP